MLPWSYASYMATEDGTAVIISDSPTTPEK